jgi:hypothetical protein
MLVRDLRAYLEAAEDGEDFGIVIRSLCTGAEITATFDVAVEFDEYGLLMICVSI